MCLYRLLIERRPPSSTITWVLLVIAFPIFGALIYWIFGPHRIERHAIRRKHLMDRMLEEITSPLDEMTEKSVIPEDERDVFRLLNNVSEYRATGGNHVMILADLKEALEVMRSNIHQAKYFIHLEYYIISGDDVTRELFADLEAAARRGVQVRILYDSLGSLFLKRIHFRKLLQAGANVAGFLPLFHFPKRLNLNFRNHRKILVVDGIVAFTGGANIGRQYLGTQTESQWRDNFVKVSGPASLQLEDVFAKDWHFTTKEDLSSERYYPKPRREGDTTIQVLESGPDSEFYCLHQAVFLALAKAKKRCWMMTPYFIPTESLMTSIIAAALRGVEMLMILPKKTDNMIVQFAARSFYEDLLKAGVKIYEFRPRILHSKMIVVDDRMCLLGSANMDVRSFRLNYELNLWIYGTKVTKMASQIFNQDLTHCDSIALEKFEQRGDWTKILENTCRLFSPVL